MESENTNASGSQNLQVSDSNQVNDSVAYGTYKKVLSEKKARDEELAELKAQLELKTQDEAQKEGRKDEVITSLRTQLSETKTKLDETYKTFAWNTLEAQIKQKAMRENCTNPDLLIRLISDEDLRAIDVGDGFSVNDQDLSRLIEKAKKDFADIRLFKSKNVNVHDVAGNAGIPQKKEVPMAKMTKEQIKQRLIQLDKQGE